VLNPWAWAIAAGLKRIENRVWRTSYRGPLAIHAGKSRLWLARESPLLWPAVYGVSFPAEDELIFGAFVAVCDLVDCVRIGGLRPELKSAWSEGPWCWVLENVRRLEGGPIACAGAQRVWTPPAQMMPKLLAASGSGGPMYSNEALSR
jgi:hypothetical protein